MKKNNMRRLLFVWCLIATVSVSAQERVMESQLSSRRFTTLDGLPQMQTETVWQDAKGYIWVGTLSGFVRYDGRTLTPYMKGKRENIVRFTTAPSPDGDQVTALNFRRRHTIDGEKVSTRKIDEEWHWLLNNLNGTDLPEGIVLLEDEQETHRQVCRLTATGWETVQENEVFDLMPPDRKLYIDGKATYVPTEQGLYVVHGAASRQLTAKDDIYTLRRIGGTLYAFAADGIYTVDGDRLSPRTIYPFAAPDYGLYVREAQGGQVYIADSHTLYIYDGHEVRPLTDGYNMIKALFVDRWDRLWMATYQGLYLFFRADFTTHRLTDGNDIIRALGTDRHGHIVMGTLNGEVLLDGKPLPSPRANDAFQPSSARIGDAVYMAGNGDVARIDGERVEWLGLPADRYQFVASARGRLIIGTRQQILSYDPQTQRIDTLSAEIPPHAWCAADDGGGRLWVGGSAGLFRIDYRDGGRPTTTKVDYPQRLIISSMARTPNGDVLFASCDSLFLVRGGEVMPLNPHLPLLASHEIRSLHVSPRGYLVVATIDGLLVSRIADDGIPTEGKWLDHRNGFTLIEPQNATMAEDSTGTVWMAGTEEMISFRPEQLLSFDESSTLIEGPLPWWLRWYVWVGVALLLACLSWWLAYRYEQRRNRRTLQRLEREKKQKELLISSIALKAIPHFHANVLAGIEYFLMNNSTDEAIDYLKVYSNFTNQTLADIDRPARTISEEVEYIRNYLELEKLRYGDRLQYSIMMSDDTDYQALVPTMALFTYCQNAVKHGIGNKPEGGQVDVTVMRRDGQLVLRVKDDGVGRAKAATLNTNSTRQGLRILHEQIALYNQTNVHDIVETVTDLYDEHGNACGTCFELAIPEDYQYTNIEKTP